MGFKLAQQEICKEAVWDWELRNNANLLFQFQRGADDFSSLILLLMKFMKPTA